MVGHRAIAGISIIPAGKDYFDVYVAWENLPAAKEGFFSIVQKRIKDCVFTPSIISHVADYGIDVTHIPDAKKLFPNLFN